VSETVAQLEQALKDQPANPLRNHQVEEYTHEQARLDAIVQAPAYVTGVNRGEANRRSRQLAQMVDAQRAKPLHGAKKDAVAKLAEDVMEQVIRPALLPREEMRRNPAGAVGKFLRQENSRPIKHAIQQWKRAQLALEPESQDPDLANVERFRPEMIHATGGVGTFMPGAQIPGNFAFTPQAKANWPAEMPPQGTVNSPLAQAQKRERTPAQIAALEKAQAARRAKDAAAKAAAQAPTEG
jgi:hypothetical protein